MTCTDKQIRKLMKLKQINSQEVAALKVGVDRKTASKYIEAGKLPSELKKQREWSTRSDCFVEAWPTLAAMLTNAPGLEAKTLLEWLIEQKEYIPPFHFGQLRTLQRRVRDWRALHGPEKSVIFPQHIMPGKQSQSDCTCMNSLKITIAGEVFPHLLFHWMLPYSRWETVSICYTESFASLTAGYTAAVWELGAVAPEHRTDNLTAATHSFGNSREFNKSWNDFLKHHGVKPSRNNPGESHENGSVEKSNDLIKKNVEQQLLLRGSRNFASIDDYNIFLQRIMKQRNQSRQARLAEDLVHFLPLPKRRWEAVQTLSVTVGPASIISVLKGIYSVPARLIGYGLDVDIYPKHLNVRYGRKVIESIPRLPNDHGVAVNYRHIIGYLLRKPGAFAHYQYRECLFPRLAFRKAYDALMEQSPARGHKDYLKVLHLAAIGSESDVTAALEILMESGDVPLPDAVKKLLDLPSDAHPAVRIIQPKLGDYDRLLSTFKQTTQGASHAIH